MRVYIARCDHELPLRRARFKKIEFLIAKRARKKPKKIRAGKTKFAHARLRSRCTNGHSSPRFVLFYFRKVAKTGERATLALLLASPIDPLQNQSRGLYHSFMDRASENAFCIIATIRIAIGDKECPCVCYAFRENTQHCRHMHTSITSQKPRIAITMGDVNGIGPEILARALARPELGAMCTVVVYGCKQTLDAAFAHIDRSRAAEPIEIIDAGHTISKIHAGTVQQDAGAAAVAWIRAAVTAAINGEVDAVVTCPINKEGIHLAGCDAIGHTEIVAEMTATPEYRMSLFTDTMRIVHITGHLPLAEALKKVETPRIAATVRIANDALTHLGLSRRKIAVAGLNPHAGENGLLGDEEARVIAPAVATCQQEGIDVSGPYPPDTVFRRMQRGEFDLVVAMYHDQGHIPLKLIAMDEGVNVTLGIPIVRTSVDHGTAYDIAWKGIASEESLIAAVRLAARFAQSRAKVTT